MHEILFSIRDMKKGQKKKKERKTIESVPITSTFQKERKKER